MWSFWRARLSDSRPESGLLLHVGYHKAGSSYLQAWFQTHPQCRLSYSSLASINSVADLIRQAHTQSLPRWFVLSNEELSGGLLSPEGYFELLQRPMPPPALQSNQALVSEWLRALYPGAQVLLVTRGVASSIRSIYSQMIRLGSGLGWSQYLENYRTHLLQWWHPDYLVGLYEAAFGSEKVLVLPYERLADDPDGFLESLETCLGLEAHRPSLGVVNAGLSALAIRCYRGLANLLVDPIAVRLAPPWRLKLRKVYAGLLWSGMLERPLAAWARKPDLPIPSDYLEDFRGKASCLAQRPLYQTYLSPYLLAP